MAPWKLEDFPFKKGEGSAFLVQDFLRKERVRLGLKHKCRRNILPVEEDLEEIYRKVFIF
jgi:hypothetical protein